MLLFCRKNSNSFLTSNRLAWSHDDHPAQTEAEKNANELAEKVLEAQFEMKEKREMPHSLEDPHDKRLAAEQLGVRHHVAHAVTGNLAKKILDARVQRRLELFVLKGDEKIGDTNVHQSMEHKRAKGEKKMQKLVKSEFYGNEKRKEAPDTNAIKSNFERTIAEALGGLPAATLVEIAKKLGLKDPDSANVEKIWEAMKNASFSKLKEVSKLSGEAEHGDEHGEEHEDHGGHGHHGLFEGKAAWAFEKFMALRRYEIEELDKMMSMQRFSSERQMGFMEGLKKGTLKTTETGNHEEENAKARKDEADRIRENAEKKASELKGKAQQIKDAAEDAANELLIALDDSANFGDAKNKVAKEIRNNAETRASEIEKEAAEATDPKEKEELEDQATKIRAAAGENAKLVESLDKDLKPEEIVSKINEGAKTQAESYEKTAKEITNLAKKRADDLLGRMSSGAAAQKDIHKLLFEKIIEKDGFYELEDSVDPEKPRFYAANNRAVIAKLEFIYKTKGANALKELLEKLHDGLPMSQEKEAAEGKKSPKSLEQRKTVKEQMDVLFNADILEKLQILYGQAPSLQKNLAAARGDKDKAEELLSAAKKSADKTDSKQTPATLREIGEQVKEANRKVEAVEKEQKKLLEEVNSFEIKLRKAAGTITSIYNKQKPIEKSENEELYNLMEFAKNELSTADQLFPEKSDAAKSSMQTFVLSFKEPVQAKLKEQIEKYDANLNPKRKVNSREFLFRLEKLLWEERGVTNEEANDRIALLSSNMGIAEARTAEVHLSANNEIAESLMEGWRAKLHRFKQAGAKKKFSSDVFSAQDAIEDITGLDPELECFRHLNKNSNLAGIRQAYNHGHPKPSAKKVREFYISLQKVLQTHSISHTKKIELFDLDWDMENLVHNMILFQGELVSNEATHRALNPKEGEEGKSKGELLLDFIREQMKSETEERKEAEEGAKTKLGYLWHKALKAAFGDKVKEARKHIKEHGLKGEEAEHHIIQDGLRTAMKHLGTALAVKEGVDMALKGAKIVKEHVGKRLTGGAQTVGNWIAAPNPTPLGERWYAKTAKFPFQLGWGALKLVPYTIPKALYERRNNWFMRTATAPFRGAAALLKSPYTVPRWAWRKFTASEKAKNEKWLAKNAAKKAGGGSTDAHGGGH